MNEFRELQSGSWRAFWSGSVQVQPFLGGSIREEETAHCLDCRVLFNIRNRTCPKCGGEQFWLVANWKKKPVAARVGARPRLRGAAACA